MEDTRSLGDFVTQHYNQNRLYDFEEDNKSDAGDDNKSVLDALSNRRNTKVCLKNLPRQLKDNGLRNLCGQYGSVTHVLFWNDRNYAFVTFASLSEAENAIRKINDSNTLGIKADFAFESKTKRNNPYEESCRLAQQSAYDTDINWNERCVKGPFSHPQSIPNELIKMEDCATNEDYEIGDLIKADPCKEFINQFRNNSTVEFVKLKKRIINGRSVHMKNGELLQKIMDKSRSSAGKYDQSKAVFSFRDKLLPDSLVSTTFCTKCKGPSNQHCRNCYAPFCSLGCEANEMIHKEICANGKMVDLKDVIDINQAQEVENVVELPTKLIQKSNTRVRLVCFVDFKTVYVRASDDDIESVKLMNDVAQASKASDTLMVPKSGSLVLAPFETIYHRALILKLLDQDEAIVAFIDYGNVDTVKIADMKAMPVELKKRPRMVTKMILKNVPDAMCNDDALNILFELLNKSAEMTIRFDEPYVPGATECELATDAFDSVNRVIITDNVPSTIERDIMHKDIMQHVKITGLNVSVLILENSSLRYSQLNVIKYADIGLFQRNHQHIQKVANYLDREDHITPGHLEYCLAKGTDNNWYRVQAFEVKYDGHITALFIDYGNINILKIHNFRRMPTVLMFPCITATVTCFDTDATPVVEAKRKELLPSMSEVTFLELSINQNDDEEYDGHCNGTLPPSIYTQADKCLEPVEETEQETEMKII